MVQINVITPEQLEVLIYKAIVRFFNTEKSTVLMTRNQVYKKYRLTYDRQKKLIEAGKIKQTCDGLMVEQSILDYINNEQD